MKSLLQKAILIGSGLVGLYSYYPQSESRKYNITDCENKEENKEIYNSILFILGSGDFEGINTIPYQENYNDYKEKSELSIHVKSENIEIKSTKIIESHKGIICEKIAAIISRNGISNYIIENNSGETTNEIIKELNNDIKNLTEEMKDGKEILDISNNIITIGPVHYFKDI